MRIYTNAIIRLTDAQNQSTDQYIVRLLSFVPGKILFSVPYTKELFFQVGELVAKTDLALMVFNLIYLLISSILKLINYTRKCR
jgi:hypothetical protein